MSTNPNHIRFAESQPHRAKIFLSCGQASKTERRFATELQKTLDEKYGFEVFVAAKESTIKELDRELLDHLKTSDYFLCVNFARELVSDKKTKKCFFRGSLYTNQEIAMATAVGFQSDDMIILSDVKVARDGLLKNIVRNDCDFSDYKQLKTLIAEKIKEREWNCRYSRSIKLVDAQFNDRPQRWTENSRSTGQQRIDWLAWVEVKNLRKDFVATNCMLHLKRIFKQLRNDEQKELQNIEPYPLKGCWVETFSHTIFPGEAVRFDLLAVEENTCDVFLRSTKDYRPNNIKEYIFSGKGIYTLEFELYAYMFPVTTFFVELAVGMEFPEKKKSHKVRNEKI